MNDSSTTATDDNQMATNESTLNGLEPSSRKRKLSMSEMSSSRIEIEILKSAIEKWKEYAQKLEAEKIQHINDGRNEGKILELQDTVSKLQAINAELVAKNEEEKNQHQAKMDSVISEYTAKIQVLQAARKQAESKIKELTNEILSIKRIKSETNDSAETERETHQTEIHTLKVENSELKKQIQAYENEKQKSVEKILELIHQASSLEAKKKQNVRQGTVQCVGKKKAAIPRVDMVTILLQLMTDLDFRHVIKMKSTDRFDKIFLDYGAKAGFDKPEDLNLLWDTGAEYKNIKYFDTPAKLKMPLNDSVTLFFNPRKGAQREIRGDGEIKIKINTRIHKEPLERFIHKEMPFGEIKVKLCAELKIKPSQVQFRFDGEKVYDDDTPADLDMEDYDCIDMYF